MTLNDIKLKRLSEATKKQTKKPARKLRRLANGSQAFVDVEESVNVEEAKEPRTPKFVQHCVAAITQDPEKLAKVQQKKDGSPFPICQAQYNKNKGSLAAKHSQGQHHSTQDYKNALATLREAVEQRSAQNVDPRSVVFGPRLEEGQTVDPRTIRYAPGA